MSEKSAQYLEGGQSPQLNPLAEDKDRTDVFVEGEDHDIHYKTLSWQVRGHLNCGRYSFTTLSSSFPCS